jgi:hypothetical protein
MKYKTTLIFQIWKECSKRVSLSLPYCTHCHSRTAPTFTPLLHPLSLPYCTHCHSLTAPTVTPVLHPLSLPYCTHCHSRTAPTVTPLLHQLSLPYCRKWITLLAGLNFLIQGKWWMAVTTAERDERSVCLSVPLELSSAVPRRTIWTIGPVRFDKPACIHLNHQSLPAHGLLLRSVCSLATAPPLRPCHLWQTCCRYNQTEAISLRRAVSYQLPQTHADVLN